MAQPEEDGARTCHVAGKICPASRTKALLRRIKVRSSADLDLVYEALFQDIGNDALSVAEIDNLCKVAIAKTRNMLIQCRFGILGDNRLLIGRSSGSRRRPSDGPRSLPQTTKPNGHSKSNGKANGKAVLQ